jgi:hypothetical protein
MVSSPSSYAANSITSHYCCSVHLGEDAVDLNHDSILAQIFATPGTLPYRHALDNEDRPVTHFEWCGSI